jgi:hypothetical protein
LVSDVRALPSALLLACVLCDTTAFAQSTLRVDTQVDRRSLTIDDTLNLRITVEGRGASAPEVTLPAFEGFDVVSHQVQRPMSFSFNFGRGAVVQSSVIYTFVLRPTRTGSLTIRPTSAQLGDERKTSPPIAITVSAGASSTPQAPAEPAAAEPGSNGQPDPAGADLAQVDDTAFLRTVADDVTPFEGQQVTVTIYLYVRDRLQNNPEVTLEPTTDGFWIQDLLGPKQPRVQRQVVGGAVYSVYPMRRFSAFPLRAGQLTIGPMKVRIDMSSVFDVFGPRRGNPVFERESAPLALEVSPLPPRSDGPSNVVVGRYELDAKLDRNQTATGDAVTLTVTVRGHGNVRTIELPTPQVPGLDVLQPEVKDLIETDNDRVGGTRELRFLIVPREPGRYRLPPFELAVFDPQRERYTRVASQPLELEVVGQALAAPAALPSQGNPQPDAEPALEQAELDNAFAPIRTESALSRASRPLAEHPAYAFLLGIPPLLFAGFLLTRQSRARARARSETPRGRAERDAAEKLELAGRAAKEGNARALYAAAAGVVLSTLEARLGAPASGVTHGKLRQELIEHGMEPALVSEVIAALERSERARFGGEGAFSADEELEQLRTLHNKLSAFSPRQGARA